MADELSSKVSTDQPMREAEQSIAAKVNALIDAYWSHNYLINQATGKIETLQSDMQTVKSKLETLQSDMQTVKSKLGL